MSHNVILIFSIEEYRVWSGKDSLSGLTHDIKMGSYAFHCDVPHQWIVQCDGRGVMSCVCGMAFLCGSTLVKVQLS